MTISLKQGMILKSSDGEYVYNIFSFNATKEKVEDIDTDILYRSYVYNFYSYGNSNILEKEVMTVDILNRNLEFIASRKWLKEDFQKQIDNGTIIEFKKGEVIGE
jgi:hypothetical protein